MSLDVESVLSGLRRARHEGILSYDSGIEGEEAGHLLMCLLEVELAIGTLERSRDPGSTCCTAERIIDDEPSVGDVAEAENANGDGVLPTAGKTSDDVVGLARALQSKARPQ